MSSSQTATQGMRFPPGINPATGRFLVSGGRQSIRESVYVILMTQKTERFTRPDFGSTIQSYPLTDPSSTRMHMMEREIRDTILSQEPRIADLEVLIRHQADSQTMLVKIDYTVEEGEAEHVEITL